MIALFDCRDLIKAEELQIRCEYELKKRPENCLNLSRKPIWLKLQRTTEETFWAYKSIFFPTSPFPSL